MNLIDQLVDRRARVWHELQRTLDRAAAEGRALTADEQAAEHRGNAELDALDERIRELRDAEQRQAEPDVLALADRATRAAATRWLPSRREYREWESRAVGTSGNPLVPTGQANTWYDRLRARSVVLAAGPTIVAVEREGSLRVPTVTASVTVGTVAEGATIAPTDPTFASVTLDPKKLAALCLVNAEALDDSNPDVRAVVEADLIRSTATELDRQLLVGDGTGSNLTGLRNVAGVTSGPSLGANGGVPTLDAFADVVGALEAANGDLARAAWFMAPRTWSTIRKLKDAQSRYQLNPTPAGAEQRSLFGLPVFASTNVPVNETTGTSTDTSPVILADMSQVIVGRARDIEVAYSADFRFDSDQVAVRVIGRFDVAVAQPAAVVVLTGVRP